MDRTKACDVYVGGDRRHRNLAARPRARRADVLAFTAAVALVGLGLPAVLTGTLSLSAGVHVETALRTTWAMLFVCAGVLRLVTWRITGRARLALLGCALASFGLLASATPAVAGLVVADPRNAWLAPGSRAVAAMSCVVVLWRALRSPAVDSRVRPTRTLAATLVAGLALLTVFVVLRLVAPASTAPSPTTWFVVGTLCAVGWLALAMQALVRSDREGDIALAWVGVSLTVLCAAEELHALAFVVRPTTALFAAGLQVVVGGLAAVNAATDLGAVFTADGDAMLATRHALDESERRRRADEEHEEERLHDARSLIAALKAASSTLSRYQTRLDEPAKQRLRSAFMTELNRLETVIDSRHRDPCQLFALADALLPVVVAEREAGLDVDAHLAGVRGFGRPLRVATVLQNLLVNARRYAGGAVAVRAEVQAETVRILVADRGPGVPPEVRDRIFLRGYQRPATARPDGSGLGLYLARQLMHDQGGDLTVEPRPGGGSTFVISLPTEGHAARRREPHPA